MTDFADARKRMVDGQVRVNNVTDPRIIAAMMELPRELFLAPDKAALAYLDLELPVGEKGRRMLTPRVLAKLVQAAEISETDAVLDVGSLTGYSAALTAKLAASVVALEEDSSLALRAGDTLRALGLASVTLATGSLADGYAAGGPYDVILLNGASEVEPAALLRQLREGGRLVGIFGRGPGMQAKCYRSVDGMASGRPVFDASAPLLPGFAAQPAFVF